MFSPHVPTAVVQCATDCRFHHQKSGLSSERSYCNLSSVFQKLDKAKLCGDAGLLDESLLRNCFQFYGTVMFLLLEMLTPKDQE